MAKMTKAERKAAAKKAWVTRKEKYGGDGHKGPPAKKPPAKKTGKKKKLTKKQRSEIAKKAAKSRKKK